MTYFTENIVTHAARYAHQAHLGQKRKYNGAPYISHPMRVAGQVSLITGATDEIVAAAWLHDVIEDCKILKEHIVYAFGDTVANLVDELTNPSTAYPQLPRHERKLMDFQHIAVCSYWARVVKCLDRIDNLGEMPTADSFTPKYCEESEKLADIIAEHSEEPIIGGLLDELHYAIHRHQYPELEAD
jgi:(p)ppGpp synthase/HD superfamily hydrolase